VRSCRQDIPLLSTRKYLSDVTNQKIPNGTCQGFWRTVPLFRFKKDNPRVSPSCNPKSPSFPPSMAFTKSILTITTHFLEQIILIHSRILTIHNNYLLQWLVINDQRRSPLAPMWNYVSLCSSVLEVSSTVDWISQHAFTRTFF
jgi:hypothetical protein